MLYCPRRDERSAERLVAGRQLVLGWRQVERCPVPGREMAIRRRRLAAVRRPAHRDAGSAPVPRGSPTPASAASAPAAATGSRVGWLPGGPPPPSPSPPARGSRMEEHTSEIQSPSKHVCRLLP